jgi:hypothetical protein
MKKAFSTHHWKKCMQQFFLIAKALVVILDASQALQASCVTTTFWSLNFFQEREGLASGNYEPACPSEVDCIHEEVQ